MFLLTVLNAMVSLYLSNSLSHYSTVRGVFFRVGTPVCHTETRMGEPGVPSDDDHTEDSCGCQEEPTSDEFLFTLLYVLLGVVVLVETSLEERR